MCGIAGIIRKGQPIQESDIQSVTNNLKHRGPDEQGIFIEQNVSLGHTRLSIIDLSTGSQPMTSGDGKTTIVFNGEIYNFPQLKKELTEAGVSFRTKSDTEVVLESYRKWGRDCTKKLRGMFAFAIYDSDQKRVFLARDHFGIKPLFYLKTEQLFAFASELHPLVQVSGFKKEINLEAMDAYLAFLYIPAPATAFRNVFKLEPGTCLELNTETLETTGFEYWKVDFTADQKTSKAEFEDILIGKIKDSVGAHLISDVDFGAFLSGGIDSTAVVSCMAEIMPRPVKTFSIGFRNQKYDESYYSDLAAKKLGTEHYHEFVDIDAGAVLPDLIRHYGEPFGDSSAIPTFYVSKMARKHVKMVLSGDGGDELLGGYKSYERLLKAVHLDGMKPWKKRIFPAFSALFPGKYPHPFQARTWASIMSYLDFENRNHLWKTPYKSQLKDQSQRFEPFFTKKKGNEIQAGQLSDLYTYLPGDILFKVDIASMMHSLEVRTPLIDKELWEFVTRFPASYYTDASETHFNGKTPLKKLLSSQFDHNFLYREKMGFAIPLHDFLGIETPEGKKALKSRFSENPFFRDIFETSEIDKYIDSSLAGPVWSLVVLDEWLKQHF